MSAVSQDHEPATLVFHGELSEDTIEHFDHALRSRHGSEVVVDLQDVTLFSAAAMRVVVQARKVGTVVRLVNPSPLTARALAAVGLPTG